VRYIILGIISQLDVSWTVRVERSFETIRKYDRDEGIYATVVFLMLDVTMPLSIARVDRGKC
jgi:hypothetical protein